MITVMNRAESANRRTPAARGAAIAPNARSAGRCVLVISPTSFGSTFLRIRDPSRSSSLPVSLRERLGRSLEDERCVEERQIDADTDREPGVEEHHEERRGA